MSEHEFPSALSGVRVLDLSRVLAGPWASQFLGDLGADVIKIERPGVGDDTRSWGPPFLHDADGRATDAAYFLAANRNKKSVAIDFSKPSGADAVRALAGECHIVIENFKVGALKKYGLDYKRLAKDNPSLVYCSITGFGQTGPYAARAGYDYMIQAMGGLMSITGQPDGAPGGEPMKVGVAVADLFAGMYAAGSILAALRHAERTGVGQQIDVALFDCQAAMLANQATNYLTAGVAPRRLGNAHPNITPYQVFQTSDGHIVVAVGNDSQFRALARLIGQAALADDERFALNRDRVANREALNAVLVSAFVGEKSADWLARLEQAGVPAGPINGVDDVFNDPHARDRKLVAPLARDDALGLEAPVNPVKFSETPPRCDAPPPPLGADTRDVLTERLGEDAYAALLRDGVIGEP